MRAASDDIGERASRRSWRRALLGGAAPGAAPPRSRRRGAGGGPARGAGRAGRAGARGGRVRRAAAEPLDRGLRRRRSPGSRRWGRARCPPRGRDILVQAYEYRGRAYFGIGLSEKASENFRQLVQLKPDHALSKETRLAEGRRALQQREADAGRLPRGVLAARGGPGHARGRRAARAPTSGSPTSSRSRCWPASTRSRSPGPGYQTETRPVSIAARDTQTLEVPLVRVLASVFFVTEPAGVEVWIDGELKATTVGQPGARAPRGGAGARARPRAGLGAHRGREPLARQPRRRAAPQVLRDGQAHPRHPAAAGLRAPIPSRWRTRSPRCASPPTRRARGSS